MVHIRHTGSLGFLSDRVLALLLRPDEEHGAATLRDVPEECVSFLQELKRLLQVDDVDAAALREDEAAHLGVPAARLMAEMHAGLQELAHRDDGQEDPPRFGSNCRRRQVEPSTRSARSLRFWPRLETTTRGSWSRSSPRTERASAWPRER